MKSKNTKFFLKVTNPNDSTYILLVNLSYELGFSIKEYWEKATDPDVKLYTEPINPRNFNHIITCYSSNVCKIDFCRFLIHKLVKDIEQLEKCFKKIMPSL